jgi:hypothetical protein
MSKVRSSMNAPGGWHATEEFLTSHENTKSAKILKNVINLSRHILTLIYRHWPRLPLPHIHHCGSGGVCFRQDITGTWNVWSRQRGSLLPDSSMPCFQGQNGPNKGFIVCSLNPLLH